MDNQIVNSRSFLPGGILRVAVAEGFFPLLPWGAFFCAGMAVGKSHCTASEKTLWIMTAGSLLIGIVLHGAGSAGIVPEPFSRAVLFSTRIYPLLPPLFFILCGVSLAIIGLCRIIDRTIGVNFMVQCLGQCSLSILFLHIVIFREMFGRLGLHKKCNQWQTLCIIAAFIVISAYLCALWKRKKYMFGFEWLIRRVDKIPYPGQNVR